MSERNGAAGLGITSGAYVENPEGALFVVDALNSQGFDLSLEIYPFKKPQLDIIQTVINKIRPLVNKRGLPVPTGIGLDDIETWTNRYPNARISQVHLPFAYDLQQALTWTVYISKDSPEANFHHLAHLFFLGWSTDDYGISLARGIQPRPSINIHQDVFEGYVRNNRLSSLTKYDLPILIEDGTNPLKVVEEIVEPQELGFTLGLDHLWSTRFDAEEVLADRRIRKYTEAIHLSLPDHKPLDPNTLESRRVLKVIGKTPFVRPVTVYLDYGPFTLAGMSKQEEVDFWAGQFKWIGSTQPQLNNLTKPSPSTA